MTDQSPPRPPLSFIRMLIANFAILIMVLSGGCTLYLGFAEGADGWMIAGPIGGTSFAIGLLIWWLAARVGRR